MQFIHEMADWPQFAWDDAKLSPALAAVRYQQGKVLGRMEGIGFHLKSEASLQTLTADVVQSSAIEGEILEPEQVRSSIARKLGLDVGGLVPSSRDVEGMVDLLLDATQRYSAPLTEDRLFGWHSVLFPTGRSGIYPIKVGALRSEESGPMQVVSGPIGREIVHFEAPRAERLAAEMADFLRWFETETHLDPLLKAGIAHFWFVTIHPFEDGNGRIGRAIIDMQLSRAEASPERFYSLSSQIEIERKDYYLQLERSQRGSMDITAWLDWFLGCLGRALAKTDSTLSGIIRNAKIWEIANNAKVNSRQQAVLKRLLAGFQGHLTTAKYIKLTNCSADSAQRDIRSLVEGGILIQNPGGGRSTSYSLNASPGVEVI